MILYIILIFICILLYQYIYYRDNTSNFVSTIDGTSYSVREESLNGLDTYNSKKEAANYLAVLNNNSTQLVNYMYDNQLPDKEIANRLYKRWTTCNLRETNSAEDSVAYTVNKCESELRICIRNNASLEDVNTSMFVLLHELAHLMSVSYGHNEEFKENFSFIVHLASKLGLYEPQDFHLNPVNYCGIYINTTPCSDGSCNIL